MQLSITICQQDYMNSKKRYKRGRIYILCSKNINEGFYFLKGTQGKKRNLSINFHAEINRIYIIVIFSEANINDNINVNFYSEKLINLKEILYDFGSIYYDLLKEIYMKYCEIVENSLIKKIKYKENIFFYEGNYLGYVFFYIRNRSNEFALKGKLIFEEINSLVFLTNEEISNKEITVFIPANKEWILLLKIEKKNYFYNFLKEFNIIEEENKTGWFFLNEKKIIEKVYYFQFEKNKKKNEENYKENCCFLNKNDKFIICCILKNRNKFYQRIYKGKIVNIFIYFCAFDNYFFIFITNRTEKFIYEEEIIIAFENLSFFDNYNFNKENKIIIKLKPRENFIVKMKTVEKNKEFSYKIKSKYKINLIGEENISNK